MAVDPLRKGLPADDLSERMCLGSILRNEEHFDAIAGIIGAEDFYTESHRRIFGRMKDLRDRGEHIDRVTLYAELRTQGQIESVGGMTVLSTLDEGLPELAHPGSYAREVQRTSNLRRLIFAGQKVIDRALMGEASPEELVSGITEDLQGIQESHGNQDDGGQTPIEVVENFPGGANSFLDPTTRVRGMPTGFTKLDEMTGGLYDGDLIIIAGRPSHGKTAISMNIAEYLTLAPRQRRMVAVFSLEMTAASLLTRMICSVGRVDAMKFRAGYLNEADRYRLQNALHRITESRLRIYDKSELTLPDMCSIIRRLVKEEGLHLAIIDYLQLIGSGRKRGSENRNQEITDMTRQLKLLAKELGIPVILLSQLSRACETRPGDHRPILSDLRDGGSIEQDSDVVAFVYREERYKPDREDLRGVAEVILGKQRNGPCGKVPLRFVGAFTRFENRAEDLYDDLEENN